jgi:rhomboid protease GluP
VTGSPYLTAGASGGLFGLVGTLIGYLYARRDPIWKKFLVRIAILAAIFAIALPVNNAAHVGGFAAGLPMGYLAYKETRPWKRAAVMRLLAGVLVVLSLLSVGLSRLLT